MQGTNRIYEAPSRLSQGLVAGLSVAVVLMAGWLAVKITVSPPAMPSSAAEGSTDGPADAASAGTVAASRGIPNVDHEARSVFDDWPAQFDRPPAAQSQTSRTALPLAPELSVARDLGPWPAGPATPEPLNRGTAARRGAETADGAADLSAPPPPSRGPAARDPGNTTAAAPRQAQRRPKPSPPASRPMPLQPPPQPRDDGDDSQ
jgi:hypothetical protein